MKRFISALILATMLLTACETPGGKTDGGTDTMNDATETTTAKQTDAADTTTAQNTEADATDTTAANDGTTAAPDTTDEQTTAADTTTAAVTTSAQTTAAETTAPAVQYKSVTLKADKFDNLAFHGRMIRDNKGANIEWAYSGFTLCGYFDGSIKMKYEGKAGYLTKIYLLITIDGKRQENLVALSAVTGTVEIANVKKGYHEITVRKGAEITAARFVLTELSFTGQIEKPKTDKNALKLEFIGDSITNGVGAIVTATQEYRYPLGSNCLASYSGILSEKLGAESRLVAMSGYGISKGATNATDVIPPIYEYVSPFAGAAVKYDFKSFRPDAVIFELGTNDHGGNSEKFISEATTFLKTIRSKYPDAPIIWMYGMGGYDWREAIATVIKNTGDKNIHYLEVKTDKTGRANHPCEESQQEYAVKLEEKLREILKF